MIWKEWIILGLILIIIGTVKEFYPRSISTYMTIIIGIALIILGYLSQRKKSKIPGYAAEVLWNHCGTTSSIVVRGDNYDKFKRNLNKLMIPKKCDICGFEIEPKINPVLKIGRLEKLEKL